jgi:putative IMPACT (imprinted ancient) family translation regulator
VAGSVRTAENATRYIDTCAAFALLLYSFASRLFFGLHDDGAPALTAAAEEMPMCNATMMGPVSRAQQQPDFLTNVWM